MERFPSLTKRVILNIKHEYLEIITMVIFKRIDFDMNHNLCFILLRGNIFNIYADNVN